MRAQSRTILKVIAALLMALGLQATAFAAEVHPKITLLTSIDEKTFKGPFYLHWGYFEHYLGGLENQFQEHFKNSGYEISVIHQANRDQLYAALHDPANVGVFWLSHSTAVSGNPIKGVQFDPRIVDAIGSDVKELFQNVHPNIRWLSIVSCNSNMILQNELKDHHASLRTQGLDNETDARVGLKEALEKSDEILLNSDTKYGYAGVCPISEGRPVLVSRTISSPGVFFAKIVYPAVTIDFHGRSVGAFPEVTVTNQTIGKMFHQTQLVFLDMNDAIQNPSDLNLTINSGLNAIEVTPDLDFGRFEITGFWSGANWKALSSPVTGKPFGVTKNLFIYQGPTHPDSTLKTAKPFTCENVGSISR